MTHVHQTVSTEGNGGSVNARLASAWRVAQDSRCGMGTSLMAFTSCLKPKDGGRRRDRAVCPDNRPSADRSSAGQQEEAEERGRSIARGRARRGSEHPV